MKFVLMVAAAMTSAALFSPTASQAQTGLDEERISASVDVKGLDLDSAAGRAIYERRLVTQIRRMCGDSARRELVAQIAARECAAKARVN